jgi:hypothetical protein
LADIAGDAAFVTFAFKLCVLCAKRSDTKDTKFFTKDTKCKIEVWMSLKGN